MRYLSIGDLKKMSGLSENHICDSRPRVGRKLLWPEKMIAALPKGTFARMLAVLMPDEDKTDFIREAVERELKRRERQNLSIRKQD
jgi:hypothetical protein